MRLIILSVAIVLVGVTLAYAHDHGPAPSTSPGFAIPNPLRPGAKAPDCTTLPETADGCTFHVSNGETLHANLPVEPGYVWTAKASAPDLIEAAAGAGPAGRQSFAIIPKTARDEDLTITFDKVTGSGPARRVVERRRVAVMLHAH